MTDARELDGSDKLRQALDLLGRLLDASAISASIAIVGGSALLLRGFVERATRDVDIVAYVADGRPVADSPSAEALARAAAAVAGELGLHTDWLNLGPVSLLDSGLPDRFLERCSVEEFRTLTVYIAGRYDLIHLKLYAAVDQGPGSKHMSDLIGLAPIDEELRDAAAWCTYQDPSPAFALDLASALSWIREQSDDR